jgi:proteic killer suppression protein
MVQSWKTKASDWLGSGLRPFAEQLAGYYSIRINDQWRVLFRWESGNAKDVQIVDFH